MFFTKLLFVIAVICMSNAVKINMQGSVNLGKDVLDSLNYYINKNRLPNGRRSMKQRTDATELIINSAFLCRDLQFCSGELETLINEYLITLGKALQRIMKEVLYNIQNMDETLESTKWKLFEEKLKNTLKQVKKILKNVEENITEDKELEVYILIDLMKRLSTKFLETGLHFIEESLEGKPGELVDAKKIVTQKLVIAVNTVEGVYMKEICVKYKICIVSFECTKHLNRLLENIIEMPDKKIQEFIRFFYKELARTDFYSILSEATGNELQIVLNDMALSHDVPTKNILKTVQKTVEARLIEINTNKKEVKGGDIEVFFAILSDMDHFYSRKRLTHFEKFYNNFLDWSKSSGNKIGVSLRQLMLESSKYISTQSADLVLKITNEVKVFLELTVDP